MKILVTGATGFIGRALCERALTEGWQVYGTVRSLRQAALLPAEVVPVQMDLTEVECDWSSILENIDVVVHLAARVHIMHDTADNPMAEFHRVNVRGTAYLAQIAAQARVKRFIFLSSIKVNGEGREKPYTEKDYAAPQDFYGVSKWEAEQALRKIESESELEVVILRPPLVYGPGIKANLLRLFQLVDKGIPLPLAGIDNQRSLIYLGNLVDGILTCINNPLAAGNTYMISDCDDVSTPELIRRISTLLGRGEQLFPFPSTLLQLAGTLLGKSDEFKRLIGSLSVDTSVIRKELNWKPPYTMREGLRATAEWFKLAYRKQG
ncbi:MAG: SDR family oxidoreductase [Nitrospirota bacterium]|nr:SDR family oxidoreductase [Nitrospirota bacterium]